MEDIYTRTRMLISEERVRKLMDASVLVCGLGGVGGYVVEALARAGVGRIGIVDHDTVSASNLNRQILATVATLGVSKCRAAYDRIKSINENCTVDTYDMFYLPENADKVDISQYDCVCDAVDTVSAKIELIARAKEAGAYIVSVMGTGNKLGTDFVATDISETRVCPLARVMRRELKDRGITGVRCVWSQETPLSEGGGRIPASISYAPAVAGLKAAEDIIKKIIGE